MKREHTDRKYAAELWDLRERLLLMAGRVEQMIKQAVEAVVGRDIELARATIQLDRQVNRDEIETDELCLLILAKWQPMATDLRFITLALKMVTDLERIGDLAVNICERALDLGEAPPLKPYIDLPRMSDLAIAMVREGLDAFTTANADMARAVIDRDQGMDDLYDQVYRELLVYMLSDPRTIERATYLMWVAHNLERIADRVTNICERVVYLVEGKIEELNVSKY